MYRARLLTGLIFISYIAVGSSEKVTWIPSVSFNLPMNFNNGKLPCSKKTVVFPEILNGDIVIESGTSAGGFVLPENGDIFLAEGEISLGPIDVPGCTAGNVYYTEKTVFSWGEPDAWASPRTNDATPDAERVPCFDDIVVFPPNSTFTIFLPDVTQRVEEIEVGGETIYNDFKEYVLRQPNEAQRFILNKYQETGIKLATTYKHNWQTGYPCQFEALKIDCSSKFCERPTCFDPIQPIGHCCTICGGTIVFDVDNSFDMIQFQELVGKIVDSFGKDNLVYHIGRLAENKVQVVVIDKNKYDQTSTRVVSALSKNIDKGAGQQMQVSGVPLTKSDFGGKILISTFFIVVFAMGGIYAYHYKVPQINYPIIMGRSQSNMFSRFNRRTESVVSLTRRDSVAPLGVSTATSFRNPLYDSKRGRVLVEESVIEE